MFFGGRQISARGFSERRLRRPTNTHCSIEKPMHRLKISLDRLDSFSFIVSSRFSMKILLNDCKNHVKDMKRFTHDFLALK